MTFLPIVRRELAVAARRTATYRNRVIFGAVALALVAVQFLLLPQTRLTGPQIFLIMAWGAFVLCLLEGIRSTADSIALERREGTLGLLLLTDVRGHHVVIAKLASAALQSLTTVVSILPAFSLPLLIGGVTEGECWRVMLALLAALFLALCAGTLVSAFTSEALGSFAGAVVGVMVFTLLPALFTSQAMPTSKELWLAISGPVQMLMRVPESKFAPGVFWLATLLSAAVCLLMFLVAGWLLHRFPRLEAAQTENALQRWLKPDPARAQTWGGASARTSPGVWLAQRTLPGRKALWLIVLGGVLSCFLAGFFGGAKAIGFIFGVEVLFAFFIKLWVAAVAPLSLHTSRRGGALELLLVTPMSSAELVRGQIDALYTYFLAPAMIVAVGFPVAGVVGMGIAANAAGMRADESPLVFGMFWFVLFILGLHALAYTGFWNGLTNARLDRAIGKTVFSVLVLPWLTMIIPPVGCLGMIGWPVFWIYWSSGKLKKRFREEAVKHFSTGADDSGWFPWSRKTGA